MGISGLHNHLQSHGTHHAFTCSGKSTPVVIDGPALAYSLWRQSRLQEGDYRKYRTALTRYITQLRSTAGFNILTVYFDGYLPSHKRDIRQARAKSNLERVKRNRGSLVHSTPPPPFVVPLTQDILAKLDIPVCVALDEEADVACAAKVFTTARSSCEDCYLISLDSDFHCFDLGQHGYYLPLDTLIVSDSSVTGTLYNFAETQTKAGVDLLQLAALMGAEGAEDSCPRAASESVELIKRGLLRELVTVEELSRVAKQFSIPTSEVKRVRTGHNARLYGRFGEALSSGEVWMPQLLEDCSQPSAWHAGAAYRKLAYSTLLKQKALPGDCIIEWIRRAETVSGKTVDFTITAKDIDLPSDKRNDKTSFFVECFKTLLTVYLNDGKEITQVEYSSFIVMMLGTYPGEVTDISLRVVHLMARWQAIVFSYTLLCQASNCLTYPFVSDLYDLQTFLKACELLQSGHSLMSLCKGHEEQVELIRAKVPWTSVKTSRKRKKMK